MPLTSGFELGGFCSLELKFFLLIAQLFLQTLVLKNKQVMSLSSVITELILSDKKLTLRFISSSVDPETEDLLGFSSTLSSSTALLTTDKPKKKEMCCQGSLYNATKRSDYVYRT